MNPTAQQILDELAAVERLRRERADDVSLGAKVLAVKTYQSRRFENTYADLLIDPRYRDAARFFLDELYGPHEFGARDEQFARIVPSLVRMFPREIVQTVAALGRLYALSESLDNEMARNLATAVIDGAAYVRAWQATGRRDARQQQVALMLDVGGALDRYTRRAVLRAALRMMRAPARAGGLGDLQRFLESGFDTFGAMKGAAVFLAMVQAREEALAAALFEPGADQAAAALSRPDTCGSAALLEQLP